MIVTPLFQGRDMRGRLVVFEGGEGGGKTTQIERTCQWLKSVWATQAPSLPQPGTPCPNVLTTREPGGTGLGYSIRQLLLQPDQPEDISDRTELLLYAADRAHHVEQWLRPYLAQGALVLCDRYTDSTIAYQGYGRGLPLDLIHTLNHIATQGLESDLTLWFDLDVAVGLARTQKRGSADRLEQATQEFHQRVRQGFADLAQLHPHRIVKIDASQDEDQVFQHIQTVLKPRLTEWYGI